MYLSKNMRKISSNTQIPNQPLSVLQTESLMKQHPAVLWLTGLSASGKSTIAGLLNQILCRNNIKCFVLDGDLLRNGLCGDLGFSAEDRKENVRRVSEVAKLFYDAGIVAICPLISPFEKDRKFARSLIPDPYFLEVFVDCSIEECAKRDPKGLYAKAYKAEIPDFTGVSSPYEKPQNPEIHLNSCSDSPDQCAEKVWKQLSPLIKANSKYLLNKPNVMKYNQIHKTTQEDFWAGEFGDVYSERNKGNQFIASNLKLFSKIFSLTKDVKSVIEFGSNIGQNLKAISQLLPMAKRSAIEINPNAISELKIQDNLEVFPMSILDFDSEKKWDFTFTKGVLIHINPEELEKVYKKLYEHSNKYICVIEYYNPSPVIVSYHNEKDKLFKRDFAGDMLDKYSNLRLIDYGFTYHRDLNFKLDDSTWFLLEKQ